MSGRPRVFRGIGASPGVAIGRVVLLDRRQVRINRYHIQPDQTDYEVQRLQAAVARSIDQLKAIRNEFVGGGVDHRTILEAHEMMLRDESLVDEARALIRDELVNAEWAVSRVVQRLRGLLERVSDSYFRERGGDIDFVGDRIVRNLVGQVVDLATLGQLDDGTVVVSHDLSPVDAALLSRQRVTAFVTEVGGKTSHTAIVARSLEIPAVVGAHGILDAAGSGDLIVVDGIDGTVMLRPSRAQVDHGRERSEHYRKSLLEMLEAKALPACTLDGHAITIAGNIELPTEIATVLNRGGEAIGLYRTEFMFLGRSTPPNEEDHYRTYCAIFDEVGDREVTIRTLDIGGEKIFGALPREAEPNPALGLRAIRYCLRHPEVFEAQIAGLLRASLRGRMRILLPMIAVVDELRQARELIHAVMDRLRRQGREFLADVPIGIMLEVPSAMLAADILARECDFFAVGTNDLLQYLLATDRANERVDYLYSPFHPAVLRALRAITAAAASEGIPVSLCGEIAGEVICAPFFAALGFTQLSLNAGAIPRIKRAVRELRMQECKELLDEALRCDSQVTVHELALAFLREKISTGVARPVPTEG
jgi:phosphotransferase system enzyme I (PtsI)